MTTVLLDTHAFVWAVSSPRRLGRRCRRAVEDPTNNLVVSAATAWELGMKSRRGRFPEAEPLVGQYHSIVRSLGATDLAMTSTHALRAAALRWDHGDPFDRMLAAQAMLEQATLVTRDAAFYDLAGLDVLW